MIVLKPQTIAFTVILLAAYFLDDYIEEFEEEVLNWDGGIFSERRSEILVFVIAFLIILASVYFYLNRRFKKESKRFNSSVRMTVDEYEKKKKILTKQALKNLMESPEYQQYLEDKKNGALKEIELTEEDKIVLSDDSDEDEKDIKETK